MYFHLMNFHRPYLQNHVLRIIMVAPIYGTGAFLGFVAPSSEFVMSCVCDVWEAVVVYSFLMLIMEYMGGEHQCMSEISGKEDGDVPQIWPLNYCFGPVQQGHMIRLPKRLALQFVILKPFMAMLNIIFYYANDDGYTTSYSIFTNIVYNTSYSLALAGLFLLYKATHDLPNLENKRLMSKFLAVKGVVFLTYWQALFFQWFQAEPEEGKRWQNFILSVESGVFTWALTFAFWYTEFRIAPTTKPISPKAGQCGAVSLDLFELPIEAENNNEEASPEERSGSGSKAVVTKYVNTAANPEASPTKAAGNKKVWLKNARAAFNPADVLVDAKQSFSRRYARHVILEDDREITFDEMKIPEEKT